LVEPAQESTIHTTHNTQGDLQLVI
jgi:hypothetical protein